MRKDQIIFIGKIIQGLLFFVATLSMAQGRILHTPPDKAVAGRPLNLSCQLEAVVTPVRFIRAYYKTTEKEAYKFVLMKKQGEVWRGTIPAVDVVSPKLHYFLVSALQNDHLLTFPWRDAKSNPEEVIVVPASAAKEEGAPPVQSPILILAPEANQILKPGTAFLAFSLSTPNGTLDAASVRVFIDGRDVSKYVKFSEFVATFDLKMLAEGAHAVKILAKDKSGAEQPPVSLMFFVKEKKSRSEKKSNFNGRVFMEGRREQIYNSDQSFAMGGADFSGNYGSIDVQGRFFLTSLEDAGAQPRDRFFLSVGNDYFTMQAGDVYPRYNDLIMWGKRVRGISGAAQVGSVKLEAVFGETYRAVEGAGQSGDPSSISRYGSYSQQLLGVRPSLNFDKNVNAGFSIVKMKDDASSIQFGANPNDNVVIGPDLLLSFDRGRLELRAQAAYSLFTRDAGLGSFSKHKVENIFGTPIDVPIDPGKYEKILVINDTTVPLDPREFTSLAYDVNAKLVYFRNLLRLGYKSIGADYHSLANSWLRKDIRGFYLSDRVRLFQNKLYATLSMERFKNNFAAQGANAPRDLNTINAGISIYPGKKLPNLNISLRDYHRSNGITDIQVDSLLVIGVLDTLDAREDSRQRDISVQLGYQAQFLNADHYISASYISAIKDDKYRANRLASFFPQEFTANIAVLSWTTNYQAPMRTMFSFSTNSNNLAGGLSDFRFNALSAFGEYRFFRDKLVSFAELRFLSSSGASYSGESLDVQRGQFRIGGAYRFKFHQSLLLEALIISLRTENSSTPENSFYMDHLIRIRYEKLF